jgi:sulfur carrier protein
VRNVHVNGTPTQVHQTATICDLLAKHGLESGQVAVELNREIVPRAAHASTSLKDGDRVEIVTFVGGG